MLSRFALIAASTLLATFSVQAQSLGNADKGRAFAEARCAECHAVQRGAETSPLSAATPFAVIARTPGMTETALAVFFRTPHAMMPNLVLQGEEMDDVIAYITSLRVTR